MAASLALDEMSDFDDAPYSEFHSDSAATPSQSASGELPRATARPSLDEMDLSAEATYQANLLNIFRERLRLLAGLIASILPLYGFLHAVLSPATRMEVAAGHFALLCLCLVVRGIAPHLPTLHAARMVVLVSYALFALGTALIAAQLTHAEAQSPFTNQFVAYSSFNHIVLSSLLLPLLVWEGALIAGIALTAMAWSTFSLDWAEIASGAQPVSASHFFALGTTCLIVFYLTHLSSVQRRQIFAANYQLQQSAAHLETLTTLDTVTGGWNRRHLERVLSTEMARSARFGHAFTLLVFDLDHFKIVNDTHGHGVGDEVLRAVERAARAAIRDTDTVARFGGDEFAVVLPETSSQSAHDFAQRLQQNVQHILEPMSQIYPKITEVTVSVGLFTCRARHIYSPDELLKRADAKLYQAKREGRNRIAF